MSKEQENRNEQEYQYNDEMTIVQNFFQKNAAAADFIRSAFPDQMDGLEDPDPANHAYDELEEAEDVQE